MTLSWLNVCLKAVRAALECVPDFGDRGSQERSNCFAVVFWRSSPNKFKTNELGYNYPNAGTTLNSQANNEQLYYYVQVVLSLRQVRKSQIAIISLEATKQLFPSVLNIMATERGSD